MSKKLKSLEEHNAKQNNLYWDLNSNGPRLNGIACPKCGEELYDSNPLMTLASMPPQKKVHCSNCDYRGCRTV